MRLSDTGLLFASSSFLWRWTGGTWIELDTVLTFADNAITNTPEVHGEPFRRGTVFRVISRSVEMNATGVEEGRLVQIRHHFRAERRRRFYHRYF